MIASVGAGEPAMGQSSPMDLELSGRSAVITGASGGIGSATALALAGEGASLLLVGRRPDALGSVALACSQAGALRVETFAVDLREPDAAGAIVNASLNVLGGIDVLVNNAGTTTVMRYDEIPDEEWQAQWELNVMAPMRLMRLAAPEMARHGWGRIVNVSSSSGKRPSGMNMAYGVTKAAQLSLSRSFADLFAACGVLVNAVTPGPIAGNAWLAEGGLADQRAVAGGRSRDELLASMASGLPLRRLGTDQEIASVILFLCSERASNVSGAAWSVDGGAVPGII
jgi:3-oxoacyl-[acyl-carrier protein] reductase